MFDINWVRNKVINHDYYFTNHGDKERQNDDLLIAEVLEALKNGVILEQYEDTGRGESCLVVGFSNNGKPIHIVFGVFREQLAIITVYIPKPPKFINPYYRG